MADISIRKASEGFIADNSLSSKSQFASLKKEYNSFKKKAAKSDMANSPVMWEKELELLQKLSELAKKEALTSEQEWIDIKLSEIIKKLSAQEIAPNASYYSPASFKGTPVKKGISVSFEKAEPFKILDAYTKSDGTIDENIKKIVGSFDPSVLDEYNLSYLLKKCCNDEGNIDDDVAQAIEVLASASVGPAIIPQILESIEVEDQYGKRTFDLSMCDRIFSLKKAGFDDSETLKFVDFLNSGFEDQSAIESQICKMKKLNISSDAIISILKALSVNNASASKKIVSDSAVKSIVSLKKTLSAKRTNEKLERENPINQLGVLTVNLGDDIMIMKGNKITYISPVEGKSVYDLRKEYDDMIAKLEDGLLIEYARRYKDANGEIDSKYLRTTTVLRNNGISYDQLIDMTDFCVGADGINNDKLNAIIQIKSSGALGADIMSILSSVEKQQDGLYSSEDIGNACDLSSAVIGGKEVAALLPEVRNKKDVKEFFVYFSQLFEDKSNLLKLLPLIKDEKGNIDKNAMDVLYNLANNFLISSESPMSESKFVQTANDIVFAAMDKDDINVNDEGAGICSIMCQSGHNAKEILLVLEKCKNPAGKIDEKLSEILWNLCLGKTNISDIECVINFCKKNTGEIDSIRSDSIISLFEKGYSKEEIINYIKSIY